MSPFVKSPPAKSPFAKSPEEPWQPRYPIFPSKPMYAQVHGRSGDPATEANHQFLTLAFRSHSVPATKGKPITEGNHARGPVSIKQKA